MAKFVDNKEISLIELYDKRISYDLTGAPGEDRIINLVDFNFGEKYWYGRVDQFNVPVVPFTTLKSRFAPGIQMKNYKPSRADRGIISGLPFVVDAFEALATHLELCALNGKIAPNDPFLSNLKIYKGYEDPRSLYAAYLKDYFEIVAEQFIADSAKVENFDHFIQHLITYLKRGILTYPLTMAGYIRSRHCPVTVSGLVVEIADLSPSNDEEKWKQFGSNPSWFFFVNACNAYGFMVDTRLPWRLVADIDSPIMNEYGAPYGLSSRAMVLRRAFAPAYTEAYDEFKYLLLQLYNRVKVRKFVKKSTRANLWPDVGVGTSPRYDAPTACEEITEIIYPQTYTKEQLTSQYSSDYFLRLYCELRLLEQEVTPPAHEQAILIDDCLEIAAQKGSYNSLYIFERIINKPFDYRGSLSYIKKSNKATSLADDGSSNDISGY
jgi:hypothetical protein